MNTSSRVPGVSRNSGWLSVDAEIFAQRNRLAEIVRNALPSTAEHEVAGGSHLDANSAPNPRWF